MSTFLSIAEVALSTGLSAYTLRYYEQIGLIAPVGRQGGIRRYGPADLRWIEFLVRLRSTGMSMRDMQRYAQLLREGNGAESLAQRQALLEAHAERLEADLRMLSDTLVHIRQKILGYRTLQTPLKEIASMPSAGLRQPSLPMLHDPSAKRATRKPVERQALAAPAKRAARKRG